MNPLFIDLAGYRERERGQSRMAGILLLDLINHRRVELLASLGHKEALTVVNPLKNHWSCYQDQIKLNSLLTALPLFENKYPDNNRPRKAIEAAELVLVNDTNETRALARTAADAADDAAAYADAAADDAAYAAAYAARAYAARAAAYAAYADEETEIRIQNQQLILGLWGQASR